MRSSLQIILCIAVLSLVVGMIGCVQAVSPFGQNPVVVARGLHQPRGIAFGPDGELFVSEAGFADVSDPSDRSTREFTSGRLSVVDRQGQRRSLLENLPTRYYPLASQLVGPAGLVAVPDSKGVRVFLAYGQCGARECGSVHELDLVDGAIVAGPHQVANLQDIVSANPHTSGETSAPEGETNPWGIAAGHDGTLYAVDSSANHLVLLPKGVGEKREGRILTTFPRDPVPTGVAVSPDGHVYVALFGHVPHQRADGQIVAVAPDGSVRIVADGLNSPIGVATDGEAVYALEFASHYDPKADQFVPRTGRILRVDSDRPTVVADGLNYPTVLALGADGALYVAVNGAFSQRGEGQIVRFQP